MSTIESLTDSISKLSTAVDSLTSRVEEKSKMLQELSEIVSDLKRDFNYVAGKSAQDIGLSANFMQGGRWVSAKGKALFWASLTAVGTFGANQGLELLKALGASLHLLGK